MNPRIPERRVNGTLGDRSVREVVRTRQTSAASAIRVLNLKEPTSDEGALVVHIPYTESRESLRDALSETRSPLR